MMQPGPLPSQPLSLSFANCEMRLASRELLVGGEPRHLEPKVFEVLAYIATRAPRVVSRQELLRTLWKPGVVGDSVLTTCVMKARRAIGDFDSGSPIIRTMHRTGYRMVAQMNISAAAMPELAVSGVAYGNTRAWASGSIASMPFQNLTGETDLVWAEFGLAALLNRTLERHQELSVVPTLEVMAVVAGFGSSLSDKTRARLVGQTLSAAAVVSSEIRRIPKGFLLEYSLFHDGDIVRTGSHRGKDLISLTVDLGQEIAQELRA